MSLLSTGLVVGHRSRSQGDLDQRVRRLAGGLSRFGVARGDCIAILMRNDIPFIEVAYGAQQLGAYAVPVNWHFKAEEIDYILKDSGAKALFGHADLLAPRAAGLPRGLAVVAIDTPADVARPYGIAPLPAGAVPGAHAYEAWLASQPLHDGEPMLSPLVMFYTSGTTGHPKGVRRPAPNAQQMAVNERLRRDIMGIKPGVRTCVPGPLYHSAPNAFAMRAGRAGDVMVLMPRFDPAELLDLIARERIDTMFMVPTMLIRLLKLPKAVREKADISSLRHIIIAAAPCPPEVKRAMIEWWGPVIYEFYGSTESSAVTLANSDDALAKPGTVGRAVQGAEIRILDDAGKALPTGQIGEIYTRIAELPDFTYHNKPDQRQAIDRGGFITSGDVGYMDADGYLFLCDRKRDMVISGGVNIYPAEIEAVLHDMPGLKDCAVFGVPDAEFGEALMAVIEPQAGVELKVADVSAYLVQHLAGYKVPRKIEIRRDLPREDSGKLFKRRLRDPYWVDAGRRI